MKKFISMVMAAAMVVTMVPATAFAASVDATFKLLGAEEITVAEAEDFKTNGVDDKFELQIELAETASLGTPGETFKITVELENAKLNPAKAATLSTADLGDVVHGDTGARIGDVELDREALAAAIAKGGAVEKFDLIVTEGKNADTTDASKINFQKGDVVFINLPEDMLVLTKTKVGTVASVKVTGDFGTSEEMAALTVVNKGIKAELDDETAEVAVEEIVAIDDIVIKPVAGDDFGDIVDITKDQEITLKLSKGFDWVETAGKFAFVKTAGGADTEVTVPSSAIVFDEDEVTFTWAASWSDDLDDYNKIVISGMEVEATTADAGDVATVTVKVGKLSSVKVADVVKVIDYTVIMELDDADEDVPVIYSGVNVANTGLNDDSDHKSLAVSIRETFPGAWDMDKAFTLSLPEGVYVTAAELVGENTMDLRAGGDATEATLAAAYVKGGHVDFEFAKRTFVETDPKHTGVGGRNYENEMTFNLTLVADPGFVGDVTLKLEGAAVDTQEVVIAKFVSPIAVKAEQNDVIIDYRYTEVPTAIVVTEAEAGLWDKGLMVGFAVENMNLIVFEEDKAEFAVNEASEMEVDDVEVGTSLAFIVEEESDEEAAVVTIDGIELFMQRNIPAGPYALDMFYGVDVDFEEDGNGYSWTTPYNNVVLLGQVANTCHSDCDTGLIGDVCDYSTEVHEAWINVVTAGRDQDDASFTTKIVVPVGETTMYAGEKAITLDVPAYINAVGYTMLPVRAVATALGINNEAVQWDQATKTVIIMYGQRIITMTAGSSVVYVSGTAIPAKAAVEIVDGRAFLGLRDLATTLGISAVSYDDATKTATLN